LEGAGDCYGLRRVSVVYANAQHFIYAARMGTI
jgi:hypothetical protein